MVHTRGLGAAHRGLVHTTGRTTQLSPQGSWYIVSGRALCSYAPQRASDTISFANTERSRVPASFQNVPQRSSAGINGLPAQSVTRKTLPAHYIHHLDIAVMHIRGCPSARRHVRAMYGCPRAACHLNTRTKRWTDTAHSQRPVPSSHVSECYKASTGRLSGSQPLAELDACWARSQSAPGTLRIASSLAHACAFIAIV